MLNFILGRAATGKTYTILEKIKTDVLNGKSVVLLVPEQFTFESERTLLRTLGDKQSTNVSVLSFTRLYDEVSRYVGGRAAETVSDFDRVLLMGTAFKQVADNLTVWRKYSKSSKFTETLLSSVAELKTSAISVSGLESVAENLPDCFLKNKIKDLTQIYAAYNAVLGNRFLDPTDNMTRLYDSLCEYKYFTNKEVYIDSFKNFTGQQYKIIDRILQTAKNVTFGFTTDSAEKSGYSVFSNVTDTVGRINNLAKKNNIPEPNTVVLNKPFYKSDDMCLVEMCFSDTGIIKTNTTPTDVTICACNGKNDEADYVAATIRKLVREENYRYRDFVVISRHSEDYEKQIEIACKKNKVFCFFDKKKSIDHLPIVALIDFALKTVVSPSTENILNFHKTGLTDLNETEIELLENYTYIWKVPGSLWFKDWDMNPNGFVPEDEEKKKNIEKDLEKINQIREKAVKDLRNFKNNLNGTPTQMAAAVLSLLDSVNAKEGLAKQVELCLNSGLAEEAEQIRLSWDAVMDILDGIVKCLKDEPVSTDEFISAYKSAVSFAVVGNIPQMLDEVTFGSADRIKPSRPKIAFIIGANQGVFPANVSQNGVFATGERQILAQNGLDILDNETTKIIDEDYLVYTSLCCPTEKLFVTYSRFDSTGGMLEPSTIVRRIKGLFDNIKEIQIPQKSLEISDLPETEETAISRMFATYNNDLSASKTLEAAIVDKEINPETYKKSADKCDIKIDSDVARRLYGNTIKISATNFDTYHKCLFGFFCKYGLRARKLEPAELSNLQRGTVAHNVLQMLIETYGKDMAELSREKICSEVDRFIKEYLQSIGGFKTVETARMRFLIGRISASIKEVAVHIAKEFAQSKFEPKYCELKIGGDEIPKAVIPFSDDSRLLLNGSVDRVDTWNGYLRVVDYKTGTKLFKLPDILVGQNMQMLIYLYAIIRSGSTDFNSLTPAGVLYMPASRKKNGEALTMNGIITENQDVISAMDSDGNGEFIPKNDAYHKNTFISGECFQRIFNYIEKKLVEMGQELHSGVCGAKPTDSTSGNACEYCNYKSVCCIENAQHITAEKMSNDKVMERLGEQYGV